MAVLSHICGAPWTDENGNPYRGAKAFFFDANTTTPRVTYADGGLGLVHDHPVIANAAGRFPAIFLEAGQIKVRVEDENGIVIEEIDGISVPQASAFQPPDAGETSITLLARTGDLKFRWGAGSHSGWVRAAGRTVGNAASGATERANADCEDLFLFLWSSDPNLTVSGGRGASAANDWAAAKTIQLPDMRHRVPVGLGSMGNANAGRIPSSIFTGDNDTLGNVGGAAQITLTTAQIPEHSHTGTTNTTGAHTHNINTGVTGGGVNNRVNRNAEFNAANNSAIDTAGAHSHTLNINNTGGGGAHPNVQPSILATWYIKL